MKRYVNAFGIVLTRAPLGYSAERAPLQFVEENLCILYLSADIGGGKPLHPLLVRRHWWRKTYASFTCPPTFVEENLCILYLSADIRGGKPLHPLLVRRHLWRKTSASFTFAMSETGNFCRSEWTV